MVSEFVHCVSSRLVVTKPVYCVFIKEMAWTVNLQIIRYTIVYSIAKIGFWYKGNILSSSINICEKQFVVNAILLLMGYKVGNYAVLMSLAIEQQVLNEW